MVEELNVYILACRDLLEQKLSMGEAKYWTNSDFEKISELIFEKTQTNLSVTTLKRIWGKANYPHKPNMSTLNTLAQFLDFKDWYSFIQTQKNNPVYTIHKELTATENSQIEKTRTSIPTIDQKAIAMLLITILGTAVIFFSNAMYKEKTLIKPSDYTFSVNKVITEGVPNSVLFTYDASKSPSDSVYIVQTWDIRRKTWVPKNGKHHSAIYYYPGFFNTKLIIDSIIVQHQDLQIATDGWLGLVVLEDKPLYFKQTDIVTPEGVVINTELLNKHGLNSNLISPKIRLFNQRDLGKIMNDNFEFETELRNPNDAADNHCHQVEVLIQCKNDIIIIPLAAKACIGDMNLTFAGNFSMSKFNDLSRMGCDLNTWVNLKIICKDRHARIFVNNILAFEIDGTNKPTGIVGVQYRFNGAGEVRTSKFNSPDITINLIDSASTKNLE